MRHFLAISALLAGTLAASAQQADEPVLYAPSYVEKPVELFTGDWGGGYIGLQFGRISGDLDDSGGTVGGHGPLIGLHALALQDRGYVVTGLEFSASALRDIKVDNGRTGDGSMLGLKGLIGYDAGPALPYATLGLARISLDGVNPDGSGGSANGPSLGVGVKYRATPRLLLGAELNWQRFSDFGDASGGDLNATTASISASFRF